MMRVYLKWMAGVGLGLALAMTGRGEPEGATIITSKQLTFDYKRYVAVFEGDVVVVDPEVRIESDRLNVMFEGTNTVKSVAASGNVRMRHQDKLATCERAVYVSSTGEVILRGDAVLEREGDRVMGDEIIFWLHDDRMTCTPGKLIIKVPAKGASAAGGMLPSGGKSAGTP